MMAYLYWTLGLFLASSVLLFALFAIVIHLQRFVAGRPEWVRTATVLHWWPVILLGVAWDYVYQHTWAVVLFWELAPRGEKLLTWRLQRHKAAGYRVGGWRYTLAVRICLAVEAVDKGHCS